MQLNHLIFRLLLALCALAGLSAAPALARQAAPASTIAATGDELWDDRFGLPGLGYGVSAVAIGPDGSIYAAGEFDEAAGLPASSVARWDGARWHPLGAGVEGEVEAIAVGDDGAVYVGGRFGQAGDALANGIAVWKNGAWSAVGDGSGPRLDNFEGWIDALAFSDGTLYAGGRFDHMDSVSAHNVAAWDGSQWHPLGAGVGQALWDDSGLTGGEVMAILPSADGVYVGGSFSHAQGSGGMLEVNHIALWNGGEWHALAGGVDDEQTSWTPISSLAMLDGDLYVAGEFAKAGTVAANNIARWNGSQWSALGSGVSAGSGCCERIYALAALGGALYAGGEFGGAGGKVTPYLAKWEGGQWSAVGGGVDDIVRGLAATDGLLVAVGDFDEAGGLAVNRIAAWDGAAWGALGLGVARFNIGSLPAAPDAVAVDAAGRVFIGGNFNRVGGMPANNIAMWDGSRWHALGSGTDEPVTALLIHNGALYVGGDFTQAGGIAASHIARYDLATGTWSALGSGVDGIVYDIVTDGELLYVGGNFSAAGGVEARDVAIWDGAKWAALGGGAEFFDYYMQDGLPKEAMTATYALALDGDLLYIGGYFVRLKTGPSLDDQTPAFHVVAYDRVAQEWYLLGKGTPGVDGSSDWGLEGVHDLAVIGGELYLAGNFTSAGGVTVNHIARYNPESDSFSALGGGLAGGKAPRAYALAAAGNSLFVGGSFNAAGNAAGASNLARYDIASGSWSTLGSGVTGGLSPAVEAIAVGADGLYVVGDFLSAGGKPAAGFARWGEPISSGNVSPAGGVVEGDGVRISFPAGAFAGNATVTYSARRGPAHPAPAGSVAVRSFRITAQGAGGQPIAQVAQPFTLEVSFTAAQLRAAGVEDAASLNLAWWNGTAWQPLLPCQGCEIDAAGGTLTVRADRLGEFALIGPSSGTMLYLPLLRR